MGVIMVAFVVGNDEDGVARKWVWKVGPQPVISRFERAIVRVVVVVRNDQPKTGQSSVFQIARELGQRKRFCSWVESSRTSEKNEQGL
jgi:hypothetical protein